MPFNLILLPLLGGFWFVSRFNGTSYKSFSYSGYRLIISASIAGLFLLIFARLIFLLMTMSASPFVFHQTLMGGFILGDLLILFGAYKSLKFANRTVRRSDTDTEIDYAKRQARHLVRVRIFYFSFCAAVVAGLFLYRHTMVNLESLSQYISILAFLAVVVVAIVGAHRTKGYSALRGHQVAFRIGFVLVVATGIYWVAHIYHQDVVLEWSRIVAIDNSGLPFFAFALGLIAPIPLNWLYPYKAAVERIVRANSTNSLEALFYTSQKLFKLVGVSLVDGKYYVGFVDNEIAVPGRTDEYVRLTVAASGARDAVTKKLTITSQYTTPFDEAIKSGAALESLDLVKVIPLSQIQSAGFFDSRLFIEFQKVAGNQSRKRASKKAANKQVS